jgi:hypothetical protein
MRTRLTPLILALFFCFASGITAFASHVQGGQITYTCVAPGTYQFKYTIYTDCSGNVLLGPTVILALTSAGCNTGRGIVLNSIGVTRTGDPYCTAIGNLCGSFSRTNHQEISYTGTTTFSAAEVACPAWKASITENARATVTNLVNPQAGSFYTEAYLNLAAGVNNSSAVINPTAPTVEFVCLGQDASLSLHAYDSDCDSLSYELTAPLSASGVPFTYTAVNLSLGAYFVNQNPPLPYSNTSLPPNPQLGYFSGYVPTTFSATYPLSSVGANWNAIDPATGMPKPLVPAYPYFDLDPATGELAFNPMIYRLNQPGQGSNSYAVVVMIKEWRKINGVITLVGSTRRDMVFIVEDCGTNKLPSVSGLTANNQPVNPGDVLTLVPGSTFNLQFASTDQPGDVLTLETDATTILPGATFTQSTVAQPTGQISWVVPSTNGFCGVRYFYIKVKDDACPIRGKKVYVIGVRVLNSGTALGLKDEQKNSLRFIAYPNPFTETVSFRFNGVDLTDNQEIEIYNGLGQQIDRIALEEGKQTIEWQNAPKFPAGNYIARLISAGKPAQTLKFMKIR